MSLFVHNGWLPGVGKVDLLAEQGRITALGPALPPPPTGDHLDAEGMVITPGLVNGHTHAAMTLLRGYGDDMPLMEWLQTRIWPAEARLSAEDIYWGTRLACLEMIRSGTICFQDMYWQYHAVAQAVEDAGIRAGVGSIMIDLAGPAQGEEFRRLAEKNLEESSRYSSRIRYVLAPHAIYTVSESNLRWLADFSERHQVPVHIHLSETAHEVHESLDRHGLRPTHYLERVGLLTPRTFLAHGVYLDETELDRIAERGATLVTNPISNMKLAVGAIFPYGKVAKRNIPIALGTDGAASNNSLDLFQEVKILSLIQKHGEQDPATLPAATAWAIATGAKAPLMGLSGRVAVGENADFLLLRRDAVEITPEHSFVSNLIYSATGHIVDTMVVDGRVIMHHRQIADEAEVRREATARAKMICHL